MDNTGANQPLVLLGIDTGGTFTDFVALERDNSGAKMRIHKVLSTPEAPERAILQGIDELGLRDLANAGQLIIVHGSTVATNATLEGKGVRTVYITNRGFKDVLTIGRQARQQLYNLCPTPHPPPVAADLCLETGGRLGADGSVIEDLCDQDITQLQQQINDLQPEAVAINLLFSFLDDRFERVIEQALPKSLFVSRSSSVLPEYKEYERGVATWLNARLGPLVGRYLTRLASTLAPSPVAVMQSSGGTVDAAQAATRAVNLLLSGPAGGLAGAHHIGRLTSNHRLLTFDMGGTSTDVALIDGDIQLTSEGKIGHYPIAVPMVDMHTIGAGGGSIATLDAGGVLQVGPLSAGARPGPACYGLGGQQATVTDANAVLGRLQSEYFLGGTMALSIDAARDAIFALATALDMTIEDTAVGIVDIANEHMAQALRVMSVQRGYDPGQFSLCCFGGAGGLHICALAEALQMKQAIVPVHGGVLSAFGMLVATKERQLSRTCGGLLSQQPDQHVADILSQLSHSGRYELHKEGVDDSQISEHPSVDLRYRGQSYTLNVAWRDNQQAMEDFHQRHQSRYGHRMSVPVELVNVRLALRAQMQPITLPLLERASKAEPIDTVSLYGIEQTVPVYRRDQLAIAQPVVGPALIVEHVSTTLIAPGWYAQCDKWGNLLLHAQC